MCVVVGGVERGSSPTHELGPDEKGVLRGVEMARMAQRFGGVEWCLLRYLRANDLDPAQALVQLNDSLEFRAQYSVDSVDVGMVPTHVVRRLWPGSWLG